MIVREEGRAKWTKFDLRLYKFKPKVKKRKIKTQILGRIVFITYPD